MKGYKVDTDQYLEVTKDEIENIALESTRTIEIDEFVPRKRDRRSLSRAPYYIVPDGKVGHDAYAVIRETIRSLDKIALARMVLTNRGHVITLEARDRGLMDMLLRYPYEVRNAAEYFGDIQDVKITKDMLELAKHIVEQKSGHFEPEQFEDHYEQALQELLDQKRKGLPVATARRPAPSNVFNLMDALKQSIEGGDQAKPATKPTKAKKAPAKRLTEINRSVHERRLHALGPGRLPAGLHNLRPTFVAPGRGASFANWHQGRSALAAAAFLRLLGRLLRPCTWPRPRRRRRSTAVHQIDDERVRHRV
ncbi:Ku protein [Bradyrhizobium erythrophlei]|uniref:non-homologous end joining protein Ku n=1 Tax=Bradyrhizobium erythrophlei TaxID=1437360 RepID=UPI003CC7F03D